MSPRSKKTQNTDTDDPRRMVKLSDLKSRPAALQTRRPVLAHLNADTTWLIQLLVPSGTARGGSTPEAPQRAWFNILVVLWLKGPQSDVASWFSTQWHVIEPSMGSLDELNEALARVQGIEEPGDRSFIDAVVVSHEFTDHCHQATLQELPKTTPVFATDEAAKLIRSWKHFGTVITTPGFSAASDSWQGALADSTAVLPPWLGIGRVVTAGNALYYHSAVLIVFDLAAPASGPATRTRSRRSSQHPGKAEAIIYSPHGIHAADLECVAAAGIQTLALLHGLHDVRIRMTAQLNLGALNGIKAARACGATYWVATHDEAKRGGGLISWFLQRTRYTLRDAVEAEQEKLAGDESFKFLDLESGDVLVMM